MPWTAIVNPVAGRGRTQKLLPELERAAAAAGIALHVSPEPGAPAKLARAATDEGHDLIACGGDGLVTEVAGVAADTGKRLAIVPTGAGNDFARVLGYDPKNPLRAFDAIANGRDEIVDLGRVNGRWYTCVTASGFDAEANRWANTVRKLSGTTLYVAAVLRTLAVYKPHRFRVTIDGAAFETTAWLVAVGNGPAYAGGMRVTPDARMDDGLLDVTIVGAMSRPEFLWTFPKVFKGNHLRNPKVTTRRGAQVHLESLDASIPMEVYADGERVGPLPGTMEAVRDALNVRVPA
ncbi:MAG TPA: diacylglycerol kinase family protein [Acidimicrobiia bacterium]|nr:diacylglycerol kinase family protein [Acidimicrobiia bacterium]